MKVQLRLNSIAKDGLGSSVESGQIDLIYSKLLEEYKQLSYSYISINQIDESLNEFIVKEPGRKIHINIRFHSPKNINQKTPNVRNLVRLEIIHQALLRIAEYDKKLNIDVLRLIKHGIEENNFEFQFEVKCYKNKKDSQLLAKAFVRPLCDRFEYYLVVQKNGEEKCKVLIYSSGTSIYYFKYFFSNCKWLKGNILELYGTKEEIKTRVLIDECRCEYLNMTKFENPPFFTSMRADISKEEREKAKNDFEKSIPPHILGVLRDNVSN